MKLKVWFAILILVVFSGCVDNTRSNTMLSKSLRQKKILGGYETISNLRYENKKPTTGKVRQEAILKIDFNRHTSQISSFIYNDQANELITGGEDKIIYIWDLKTKKIKRKILGFISKKYHGMGGMIGLMSLSNDKKYLAVNATSAGGIRIYDYKTGKMLLLLTTKEKQYLDVKFSSDDKYLIASGLAPNLSKRRVYVWRVSDFKLIKIIQSIGKNYDPIIRANIEKVKNDYNIYILNNNQFCIYSINKNKIKQCKTFGKKLSNFAFNKNFITISTLLDKSILILDKQLNLKHTIKNDTYGAGLLFSPDGSLLFSSADKINKTAHIYNLNQNYKQIQTIHAPNIYKAVFLNNQKLIVASALTNGISMWDIAKGTKDFDFYDKKDDIAKISLDGSIVSLKDMQGNVVSVDINLGKFVKHDFKSNQLSTICCDYKLSYPKAKSGKGKNRIYIIKNSKKIAHIKLYSMFAYKYFISKKYIFINPVSHGGIIYVYNLSGNPIAELIGHQGLVDGMSVDGDKMVSYGVNGIVKFWDLSTLKDLKPLQKPSNLPQIKSKLSLKIINHQFIAWTDEGFFTASKGAEKYIGYHINQGVDKEARFVSIDKLYDTFYRPDLIAKTLKGESLEKYAKNIDIQKILKSGFAPEVAILNKTKTTKKRDLKLRLQVCEVDNGGYDNLTLYLNGMAIDLIDKNRALKLKQKSISTQIQKQCFVLNKLISLQSGKNVIGFKATNGAGVIESNLDEIVVNYEGRSTKKPNLYIFSIAVDKYRDKALWLKYSINDAKGFEKAIKKVAKPLFKHIYTYNLFNQDVKKDNILKTFKKIGAKTTRDDVFILYVAGHGITDEESGSYFFIPSDFRYKNSKSVKKQGISQKDLTLALSQIKAMKSLVLLDTCNSGSFVKNLFARGMLEKTAINKLTRATGRATLVASSESQVALEGYKGHGVFTYTLIEALGGKGYGSDDKITIKELASYIEDVLPDRTYEKWGYEQVPQSNISGNDFPIGVK